jgi:hypothetical protein
MGWLRKQILKIVIRAIRENGIEIGEYTISEEDGALTIKKK